jgi:hypothetical protein
MTFTYTPSTTPTDLTLVRYHTSDTVSATAIHSDEEINMVLAVEGTVGKAVVSLIKKIMAMLAAEPDMKADWLQIDWRRSAENWKTLLAEKKAEFGLGWQVSSGGQHAYRPDSLQKESPDYGEE